MIWILKLDVQQFNFKKEIIIVNKIFKLLPQGDNFKEAFEYSLGPKLKSYLKR